MWCVIYGLANVSCNVLQRLVTSNFSYTHGRMYLLKIVLQLSPEPTCHPYWAYRLLTNQPLLCCIEI
uniref:Uncharacterized protein n=1 Tax=Arundo donax TaxID=35708 RepID=A0A0A9H5D1_ARUDO